MTDGNTGRAEGQGRVYQASGDQHITEHHHYVPEVRGPDSVRYPAVGLPPVRLRNRVAEMNVLRGAVEPGVGNRIYVLHGLGGCGKTAVAYALFQHATTDAGRVGLWVNASDAASLRAGMLAVAADLGASDAELTGARSGLRPAADLVWHYLDHSDRPWLLVLDNADTPAILRDGGWLRTSSVGTVVVTSRRPNSHWWPTAELLQFGVLPRDDAAMVLHDLAPDAGSAEDAAAVADRLGRLPLALVLAGRFLSHQIITPWTLADYDRQLSSANDLNPIDLIDQGSAAISDDDPRHLVSRTWQLSLDSLADHGLPESAHLLRLLACWADDPLPIFLLSDAGLLPDLPASRVDVALRGLLDQSLTELVPGTVRCIRTHGVLLDSVAHAMDPVQSEQIALAATGLLVDVLPEIPQRSPQDTRLTLLAPHVLKLLRRVVGWRLADTTVEAVISCALQLIIAVHRSADYALALAAARDTAHVAVARFGAEHVLALRIQHRIGRALFRLGQFEESEEMHRQTLTACERVLGPDAPETLDSCYALASPLINLGRCSEAIVLRNRASVGRMKLFGNSHPLSYVARSGLIEASLEAGSNCDVADVQNIVEDVRSVVGESHEIWQRAELFQAYALIRVGRSRDALPYARRALSGYKKCLGADHPITLNAMLAYSQALVGEGRYDEAISLVEELLMRRIGVLGPNHLWTLQAQTLLEEYRMTQEQAE